MIPDEYEEVVQLLLARTREGKINWSTSGSSGEYAVRFNDFVLTVTQGRGYEHEHWVGIRLYDEAGQKIDNMAVTEHEEGYKLLQTLYENARRKAKRIDEALETIKQKLETGKVVGRDLPGGGESPDDFSEESLMGGEDDLPF